MMYFFASISENTPIFPYCTLKYAYFFPGGTLFFFYRFSTILFLYNFSIQIKLPLYLFNLPLTIVAYTRSKIQPAFKIIAFLSNIIWFYCIKYDHVVIVWNKHVVENVISRSFFSFSFPEINLNLRNKYKQLHIKLCKRSAKSLKIFLKYERLVENRLTR